MKLLLVVVALLAPVCLAFSPQEILDDEWELFKAQYKKIYTEMEEFLRKKVYTENKHLINTHNIKFHKGLKKYALKMNKYGDLMHHEFIRVMNGYAKGKNSSAAGEGATFMAPHNFQAPASVDWRQHGYVTEVKNQGQCGSCWAFSSTGSLEGQHFRKTKKLVSLSEQNLVDCSKPFGNNGCEGGLMDQAFKYVRHNHGLDTEAYYPYNATDGTCHYSPRGRGATDTGFTDVPAGDEDALKNAVASVGPVSVAIDASQESFQFYSHGVYDEPNCSSDDLDHGVLVVGYGTDDEGKDYWIVKNSWGTTWGENGYIKMSRNRDNQCGIASQASYPLV